MSRGAEGRNNQLVWFRRDLRVHDHAPLVAACARAQEQGGRVVCVFILSERLLAQTSLGFARMGAQRRRFLWESLQSLDQSLRERGAHLVLLNEATEQAFVELCEAQQIESLHYFREDPPEEQLEEQAFLTQAKTLGVIPRAQAAHSLHARSQLPFEIAQLPEVFSKFRRKVEKLSQVSAPLAAPEKVPGLEPLQGQGLLEQLSPRWRAALRMQAPADERQLMHWRGGEGAALERLEHYIFASDSLRNYKETRNGMLALNDATKLSPWLALGCLSPRRVYQEIARYENERCKNESTYWLYFELLWRDYFIFLMAKHGARLFQVEGVDRLRLPWRHDAEAFQLWCQGKTGYPLVDANQQELLASGFMSNRGRQNVASFLTKNLGIDWRWGAKWFEAQLLDYDPCSNYGNWNYSAGVGNDPRQFRWFNIVKQAEIYDPQGQYVKHWLPELKAVPPELVHEPWLLRPEQQSRYQCLLGHDYPAPMVELFSSMERQKADYEGAKAGSPSF